MKQPAAFRLCVIFSNVDKISPLDLLLTLRKLVWRAGTRSAMCNENRFQRGVISIGFYFNRFGEVHLEEGIC